MKRLPIVMVRDDLKHIPTYEFPSGFWVRNFQPGDEDDWAKLKVSVDEFQTVEGAHTRFQSEFASQIDEFTQRCLFVVNDVGEVVGTATAWRGIPPHDDKEWGRLHWVSIAPDYQGRGLAKPLLSNVLNVMATYHDKVYLTSQTTSFEAVNLYLQYGFKPLLVFDTCDEAWALLEEKLQKKIL